ncbi:MAG: hypothetical protein AB1757_26440 [Acidobacteriota bacterium]
MEKLGKTEDGVMDHLLRNYLKRQVQPNLQCEGFDPDLANAYLERAMKESEQAQYEFHLSACSMCRQNVIALARLVEADGIEVKAVAAAAMASRAAQAPVIDNHKVKSSGIEQSSWLAKLKAWLGLLASPQFALAASAAIILAIAIPLVLTQKNPNSEIAQTKPATEDAHEHAGRSVANPATPPSSTPPNSTNPAEQPSEKSATQTTAGKDETGAAPASASTTDDQPTTTPASEPAKEERAAASDKRDEAAKTDDTTAAPSTAQPEAAKPAPAAEPLGRVESKDATRVEADSESGKSVTIKKGNTTDSSKSKESKPTIRPESSSPSASAPGGSSGTPKALSAGSALREPSSRDRVNPANSRRISGKRFWLVDGVWTDENFRSDKKIAMVTVVKDSDTYKSILEKHSDLQKYFSAFDRAIIVYKDIAYKLIPQDGK